MKTLTIAFFILTILLIRTIMKHNKLVMEVRASSNSIDCLRTRLGESERIIESHIKQTGYKIVIHRDEPFGYHSKRLVPQSYEDYEINQLKKRIRELQNKNNKGDN